MTLTITLTAQLGSTAGVNFNTEYASYFASMVPTGWPYILGGSGEFSGDQIVLLDKMIAGQGAQTKAIILDGKSFDYYFNDHTLSGTLTTVRLSTLGDSYNSADQSFDRDASGHITNVTTRIEISGLTISNAYGTRGDVHNVIYGLMGGANSGGSADATALSSFLWAQGHNVIGSAGADTYSGTAFADTVRGNGGDDVFDGKDGKDIAIFSGKVTDYTITANTDGSITVLDNRTGKDGKDTLKNIETAQFSDGNVDLTKLSPSTGGGTDGGSGAPVSLALSKATVAENVKIGTTIGTFSAADPEGGALTYSLLDTANGAFKLSGNKLQVAKAIDYEKLQSDTVKLQVTDADGLSSTKVFTIKVTDKMETISGTSRADTLKGGIGADKIVAGAGNDVLIGGLGADDLYGGAGSDKFRFADIKHSTVATTGRDTIFDFSGKGGDRIDLAAIDAVSNKAGNQAFTFIETQSFHKKAGELRYEKKASDTYIYGDVNGDGKADFAIHLDDAVTMTKGYFLL
ncbi:cadherin domain-containing protein [Neorhizobium alkalisoli]|uniref:Heme-binding protein A (HasA) n=1 Tax=Neorhizobium alkalisoli TaxID=528178 RepID=A0A561R886_9HYPH|nr:cadherin domain-containing protein [Neorhizobium alkalisoli]TWF58826.1 heme-binding protein A (HasA) [Neorhizobium alkalisoli]